jgi:hypothetical protein
MKEHFQHGLEQGGVEEQPLAAGFEKEPHTISPVESPQAELLAIVSDIDQLDREIIGHDGALSGERSDTSSSMESGAENRQQENKWLEALEHKRDELTKQQQAWIRQNGRDGLPANIVLGDDKNGRETYALSLPNVETGTDGKREPSDEPLDVRRQRLKTWKEANVAKFEKALRNDRLTQDATNLNVVVNLMKTRLPKILSRTMRDYESGRTAHPPYKTVVLHWKVSGFLERMMGGANEVADLEVALDGTFVKIAAGDEARNGLSGFAGPGGENSMEKSSAKAHDSRPTSSL